MGLFRRKNASDGRDETADTQDVTQSTPLDDALNQQAQEVMKDNLEMMKDIVFRIRDDPEFAKGIYKDCPRLQHLLDQYPDLRPIFEDPKMVRINFEQVYRDAGGVLPEDEEKKKKSWLIWFVNSPIFKFLKLFLFVKKLVGCIAGGGFAFVSGCLLGCCFEDALEELEGGEADGDADGDDAEEGQMDPSQEALNRAADHMEDPEVQEQMDRLLQDPDNLQDAIENDSELKALRDSNPLCEELMNDPETMRVLTDPDNLRALGEAPQLIEADFIDPEGFMPTDVETGGLDSMEGAYDAFGGEADVEFSGTDAEFDIDVDADAEADDGFGGEGEGEEEDEGWWEDAEIEQQEAPESDGAQGQAKGQQKQQKKSSAADGKGGGIMASIGVAATELVAAQVVGSVFGAEFLMGGGGGDMGGLDGLDVGDDLGDVADDAGDVINDDVADVVEDTTDEVEDTKENDDGKDGDMEGLDDVDDNGKKKQDNAAVAGGAAGGGAVAGGAVGVAATRGAGDDEVEEAEEEQPKKSRFGFIGNMASAIGTAAKEHIATTILGDDFGEALVERFEEDEEEEEDEDNKKENDEDEDSAISKEEFEDEDEVVAEDNPKKGGVFGRR